MGAIGAEPIQFAQRDGNAGDELQHAGVIQGMLKGTFGCVRGFRVRERRVGGRTQRSERVRAFVVVFRHVCVRSRTRV